MNPLHCHKKGPYFKDLVLNKDLFGILGPYWVLIYISGSLFSLFWLHSRKECQFSLHVYNNELSWSVCDYSYICYEVMLHTLALLPNFDFYVCLRIKFHKSSFWVLILAAGGPYWVSISQKNGSLSQSLGVPNCFGNSGKVLEWNNTDLCLL